MATLRDIRGRIAGVKSTQKITKAMKMISAAKLRRAQDAIIATRPYARKLHELLQHLSNKVDVAAFPHFENRPVYRLALIVVTADRGLCGGFNSNLIRTAVHRLNTEYRDMLALNNVDLIVVGRKSADFFGKRRYSIANRHTGIFASLQFSYAQEIAKEVTEGFLQKRYDCVEVIYNEFKSIIQQRIAIEQVLPITTAPWVQPAPANVKPESQVDYLYEPSLGAIVHTLVPKQLDFHLWRVLLESNAAEQGARMTAMDNATTNANDLINGLQLIYNKARQAAITKELLEIVSGAEALKQAG